MNKSRLIARKLTMFGDNDVSKIRVYSKQFRELISAVFNVQAHFRDFFAGDLEALDGISERDTAFSVKVDDIAVAITEGAITNGAYSGGYNTGANVAFGSGTGSTSRFGNRTEIIYKNADVPYLWNYTIHEGLDRHTVNAGFDEAIADRLDKQAQAQIAKMNVRFGKWISAQAGHTINKTQITATTVTEMFNEASKWFVNKNAVGVKVAKVTPDVWNCIVDNNLATTAKGSTVNMDQNEVRMFKGFVLDQYPEGDFASTSTTESNTTTTVADVALFYVVGIGKAFVGISTTRTIESEDFDGVALQGAGKGGQYIPAVNKQAVVKATLTTTTTGA